MEKTNNRKLAASAVLIVASVALLLGLTFAWFTDTVASKGNRIQAGTLEVQLWSGGEDISSATAPVFAYEKWEPGYSTGAGLAVKNAGSLAVKYELTFRASDASAGKGIENAIEVTVDGAPVGTLAQFLDGAAFDSGTLEAGASSAEKQVVLKMREDAGNAYQGAAIEFDILLVATQAASEADGFGSNQYDAAAGMPLVSGDAASLSNAIGSVADGGTIVLGDSFTIKGKRDARFEEEKTVTVDFGGNVLTSSNGNGSVVAVGGKTVLSNGTITAENTDFCTVITGSAAVVSVEGMVLNNSRAWGCSLKATDSSTIDVRNTQVNSTMGGGAQAAGGTVNVYGGSVFTQDGSYDHNSTNLAASNGGTANVYGGTFGSANFGLYVYNSGGTINVHDGSFGARTVLKADRSESGTPSVINVYGGSFQGSISIASGATLSIKGGTFSDTGLSLDQFTMFVAEGHAVSESNGVFTVS